MSNQHRYIHFDDIPDYPQKNKVEHKLTDVIVLTICSVLSGQVDWKALRLKPKICGFLLGWAKRKCFK